MVIARVVLVKRNKFEGFMRCKRVSRSGGSSNIGEGSSGMALLCILVGVEGGAVEGGGL